MPKRKLPSQQPRSPKNDKRMPRGVEIFPDWSEEDERILDQIWAELGYPPDDDELDDEEPIEKKRKPKRKKP